jgi:uncharacterized protein YchJ
MADTKQPRKLAPEEASSGKAGPRGGIPAWLMLIVFVGLAVLALKSLRSPARSSVDYGFFLQQVDKENVRSAVIRTLTIEGKWENVETASTDWRRQS